MEIWKDIEGYEGLYQVSNIGRVKSLERTKVRSNNRLFKVSESILKPTLDRKGYERVKLADFNGGKSHRVHRLVAQAFIPNHENKPQVNHIDHNKENNKVSNLEWCTCGENIRHSVKEGRISKRGGEHNNFSKLTNADCIFIIDSYKQFGPVRLSKMFGVGRDVIWRIWKGKSWKHLQKFREENKAGYAPMEKIKVK